MTIRNREGFTLVELLVVIAIIGILIALLLPAINAAREASRRSQCLNNLKQMALANVTHAEAKKRLPPGQMKLAAVGGNCDVATDAYTNWAIEILPYIEESALYNQYDQKLSNLAPVNVQVASKILNFQCCPSDPTG